MNKLILSAAAALLLAASPAYAGHCPKDVKHVKEALAKSSASAENKAKAQALMTEGDAMHKAGKHGESLKALHEALHLLGEKHR
ncbi:MAG: hypothetical protein CMM77_09720 [Rhodospirillaceae bacterium]|nr:hypothetical protein [Magnetovibrio sp.]MAY67392.1 hypothetical protein [Rhodospirillaceae bacterium]|tara:strand:+ start:151 stop:402 length:252 start_codon:yes stop_codon:yes gene_type:complete